MKNRSLLEKGIKFSGIALPIIILSPVVITMGFKGLKSETHFIGWLLLLFGLALALTGMYLLSKGIKLILDYLFEK